MTVELNQQDVIELGRLAPPVVIGKALRELCDKDTRVRVVCSDCIERLGLWGLKDRRPEAVIEAGIAEQNAISMAAALANEGCIVYVVTYAVFITARVLDQVRVNMGYMRSPVRIIGMMAGFGAGPMGATHMALEDIADMRAIPGIAIATPADNPELYASIVSSADVPGPIYIRATLQMAESSDLHANGLRYVWGKYEELMHGDSCLVVTAGTVAARALRACEALSKQNVACGLISLRSCWPLDKAFASVLKRYPLVVTAEEHSVVGGLGGTVAEIVAGMKKGPRLVRLGFEGDYPLADLHSSLVNLYGLDACGIEKRLLSELADEDGDE